MKAIVCERPGSDGTFRIISGPNRPQPHKQRSDEDRFAFLVSHALKEKPLAGESVIEHVLNDAGSAVPFCLIVDALGSSVAARFGVLRLVGRGRVRVLTPGPLTSGSVVIRKAT